MGFMAKPTEHKGYTTVTPSDSLPHLIDALDAIRKREHLSVPEFASRLGISYAALAALLRGARRPGSKSLSAIMQVFPELTLLVMAYLQSNGRQAADAAVDNTGAGDLTSRPPREARA